nr:MAG TPA: hypothetical protein [Caudoviricetes sp.]
MKKYGEDYKLTKEDLDVIATYMEDDAREKIHSKMAPCEPEAFLKAYVKQDPDFEEVLKSEFSIEL